MSRYKYNAENKKLSLISGADRLSIDNALSSSSENAVQNKVIVAALNNKQDKLTFDSTPTANSTNPVTSGGVKSALDSRDTAIAKCECLVLSASGVSALPYDFSNANIETDMVCINSVLSNPSAQLSDWEVDTDTAGRARITGAISGTTDIKLYLMKSR